MIPFWSAVGHFEEEECEVEKEVDATEEEEILPRGNSILLRRSWKRKTVFFTSLSSCLVPTSTERIWNHKYYSCKASSSTVLLNLEPIFFLTWIT